MNGKKRAMYFVLIASMLCLALYIVLFRINRNVLFLEVSVETGYPRVRMLEQQLNFLQKPESGKQGTTLAVAELQESYEGEPFFFLPGHFALDKVYVICGDVGAGQADLTVDGVALSGEAVVPCDDFAEKEHRIVFGEQELTFRVLQGSLLPSVWIETVESTDYIHEDKNNVSAGQLTILDDSGETTYAGKLERIKGRGNSSWWMQKKSYGIKLSKSGSLLGMTPGKNWVLQGGALDETNLRNKIFMDMAMHCGMPGAVDSRWVDFYLNGVYCGCYLLTEKIEVADGRLEIGDLEEQTEKLNERPLEEYGPLSAENDGIPLRGYNIPNNPEDLSGGYLLEVEMYLDRFYEEQGGFITKNGIPVLVKNPQHVSGGQLLYISSHVQQFEDALYSETGYNEAGAYYLEYIDLESFALRYLIDEVSKNIDAGFSSYFFYKPRGSSQMYAGPVWDYDTALGNNFGWGDTELLQNPEGLYMNRANWSEQLWEKEDFREEVKTLYKKRVLPYLDFLLEEGLDLYADTIYESTCMDAVYCGRTDTAKQMEYVKEFLQERRDYLEDAFADE